MLELGRPRGARLVVGIVAALVLLGSLASFVSANAMNLQLVGLDDQFVRPASRTIQLTFNQTGDHWYQVTPSALNPPSGMVLRQSECVHFAGGASWTGRSIPFVIDVADDTTPGTYQLFATLTEYSDACATSSSNGPWSANASFGVQAPTTTSLTSTPNPSTYGASVTFTATVAGGANGNNLMHFWDGTTSLGTANVSGTDHHASVTVSNLTAASHSITALYAGDSTHGASTSNTITQVVQPADPSFHINSPATKHYGDAPFTVTTTKPADDNGAVTFSLDPTSVACSVTPGGLVTITGLVGGFNACRLVARLAADANYNAATATAMIYIGEANSTSTLTLSSQNVSFGTPVTLTDAVTPANATGWVAFRNSSNGTNVAFANVSGGTATTTISYLSVGTYSIVADYSGDINYNGSGTWPQTLTIAQAHPTTTVTSSANPSTGGQSVTFMATVSVWNCTGTVTFRDGSTNLGSSTAGGGPATFTTGALSLGTHRISAVFTSGDANCTGSTSGDLWQVVNKTPTAVTLASSPNPSTFGQSVTFTATVPAACTGTVTFRDGAATLTTGSVTGGSATYGTSALATGTHSITAVYGGDANCAGSTSEVLSHVVNRIPTTVTLTSVPNPSFAGDGVTITATVNPIPDGGTITFLVGSLSSAAIPVDAAGRATTPLGGLPLGDHTISASFSGTTNYAPSTGSITQTVLAVATTTSLSSSGSPSNFGEPVTFTATVGAVPMSPLGGMVTFTEGAETLVTVPLGSAGQATFTTTALSPGSHTITATFTGTNYGTSSATVVQVVKALGAGFGFDLSGLPGKPYGSQTFSVTSFVTKAVGDEGTVTFALGAGSDGCSVTEAGIVTVTSAPATCDIAASIEASGGFAADSATDSFLIAPAALRVTAGNKALTAGAAVPDGSFYTYQLSGWVNPADAEATRTDPTCTSAYTATTPASTLPIVCSGGAAPANYIFDFVNGTLNVGAVQTPPPTATPTEEVGGRTSTPSLAVTPPSTTTPSGTGNGSTAPLAGLLICLAFGGLGLLAVTAQRRSLRG